MKKILSVSSLALFCLMAVAVKADTWLLVPTHYWSDGSYRPTLMRRFGEYPYPYSSSTQCSLEARKLHTHPFSRPHYSMCTAVQPDVRQWH